MVILVALGLLGACTDLPRDPDGTLELVRERGTIRLGVVEGAAPDADAERALAKLRAQTGASIQRIPGHGEALLEGLEEGKVDLVFGHFADDSPWASHVHLGTPPAGPESPPKSLRLPRFAFKNGENGWISTVESAAK